MTANLRSDYYEQLWESVPADTQPPDLELRRSFLLDQLARAAERPARSLGETSPSPSLRVLDVGCGEGQLTADDRRAGHQVLGVDVAEEPLRRARLRHADLELRRVEPSGEWPLADASFDVVWSGETIEHVADTARWLSELRRVLRSGGSLILSTPAHGPLTAPRASRSRARRFDAPLRPARRPPALLHAAHAQPPARGLRLRAGRDERSRWRARRAARAARERRALALLGPARHRRFARRAQRLHVVVLDRDRFRIALCDRFRRDRLRVQVDRGR